MLAADVRDPKPDGAGGASRVTRLLDHWRNWRDRRLTDPAFLRRAIASPLFRPVARRRARALFDLCAGFVYSQVLFACVRLRVFELLAEGPLDARGVAGRLSLEPEAAARLLRAAASLDLVEGRGRGRYGLGKLGAALLANPGVAAMVEHHALLYADLSDPVALLRGEHAETALGRFWSYARSGRPEEADGREVSGYSALMAASQALIAETVLAACPLRRFRTLLDVGGGEGVFLSAAATRAPNLRVMLFDLPAVAERAASRFAEQGLGGRAETFGGDFFRDPLPRGADAVSLIRVVHDHGDAEALQLLRAVRAALPPNGMLILGEPMAATPGAEPAGGAYFELYLLAMGSGRPRTPEELETLLRTAGFGRIRRCRTAMPLLARVLLAQPGA